MDMVVQGSEWVRRNFFGSIFDAALSILALPLTAYVVYLAARWVLVTAQWSVIGDNLRVLLTGTIPVAQEGRAWVAAAMLLAMFGATLGSLFSTRHTVWHASLAILAGVAALALIWSGASAAGGALGSAGAFAAGWAIAGEWPVLARGIGLVWLVGLGAACAILSPAGTINWGGLLLSVLVTAIATLLSLPLGIVLAFGRRSGMPSLRLACTSYIEFVRSIPLISVIYWAWIVVPLVLPPNYYVQDLVRGIGGFVLFYAAFVAEYVRAGLQGIPRGQTEAAQSLGLGQIDLNFRILLPQAIRAIIPALVGNVLDIFNNVPLIFIIGLTDFLKAGQTILANPQYSGSQYEVYAFLFAAYFVIGSLISFTARRVEFAMGVGIR
jgi:general L-amino acid transport system permease protein